MPILHKLSQHRDLCYHCNCATLQSRTRLLSSESTAENHTTFDQLLVVHSHIGKGYLAFWIVIR